MLRTGMAAALVMALSGSGAPVRAADCNALSCSPDLCRHDGLSIYSGAERIISKGGASEAELEEAICRLQCDKVEVMLRTRPSSGMIRGVANRPTPFFPHFLMALGYDQLGCPEQSIREWKLVNQNVITRNAVYQDQYARFSASIGAKRDCEAYRTHLADMSGWDGTGGSPRLTDAGKQTLAKLREQAGGCNAPEPLAALQTAVAAFQQQEADALRAEIQNVPGGAVPSPSLPAAADIESLQAWRTGFRTGYSSLDGYWRKRYADSCSAWKRASGGVDAAIAGSAGFLQARNAGLLQTLSGASSADPAAAADCGAAEDLDYRGIRDRVPRIESRSAQATKLLEQVDSAVASARQALTGRLQALRSSVASPGADRCPRNLAEVSRRRVEAVTDLSKRFDAISSSAGDALVALQTDLDALEKSGADYRQELIRERDRILERNRAYLGEGDGSYEGLKSQDASNLGALCDRARDYIAASNRKKEENWTLVRNDLEQGRRQLEQYRGFFRSASRFVPDSAVPECIDRELGWLAGLKLDRFNQEASDRSNDFLTCGDEAAASFTTVMGGVEESLGSLCRMRGECYRDEAEWSSTGFSPMDSRSASQLDRACEAKWEGAAPDQAAALLDGFGGDFRPDRVRSALQNCVVVGNISAAASALHAGRIDDGLAALQPFAGTGPPGGTAGLVISGTGACLFYLKTLAQPDADPRVRQLLTRESQRWAQQYFRLSKQNPSVSLDGIFPPVCVDRFHAWGAGSTSDRSG